MLLKPWLAHNSSVMAKSEIYAWTCFALWETGEEPVELDSRQFEMITAPQQVTGVVTRIWFKLFLFYGVVLQKILGLRSGTALTHCNFNHVSFCSFTTCAGCGLWAIKPKQCLCYLISSMEALSQKWSNICLLNRSISTFWSIMWCIVVLSEWLRLSFLLVNVTCIDAG